MWSILVLEGANIMVFDISVLKTLTRCTAAPDENLGFQSRPPIPGLIPPSNQLGNAISGAGSGLIREGLGAYGKRICGSSSQYVQSNVSITIMELRT